MLKKINLVLASLLSLSALANNHGAHWSAGVGYGQMFGMRDLEGHSIDKPVLMELDLFHCSGFGLAYMTNAHRKQMLVNGVGDGGKYSFNAYFLGMQRPVSGSISGRVLIGLADQKYVQADGTANSSASEFAAAAALVYNKKLSGNMEYFAETGYLDLRTFQAKEITENESTTITDVKPSGFYWKLGFRMPF